MEPTCKTCVEERCYAFDEQALEAFKKNGGYDDLVNKTGHVSRAIGGTTGGLLVGGGTTAAVLFLGLTTGPLGLILCGLGGLLVGASGGTAAGHKIAQKLLKGSSEFQVWKKKELKEERIKAVAELFQQCVKEDPFLKRFRCPLAGKLMLAPTLIVGRPQRYDLTSLMEQRDEKGNITISGEEPFSLDECKPDRLLTLRIQHRLMTLLAKEIEKEEKVEEVKELLTLYLEDLRTRHEEAIVQLKQELAAIHTIQHLAFQGKFAEPCRKLSRLLFQCRTLQFRKLLEQDTAENCSKTREEQLETFKNLQKELNGLELEGETRKRVHDIESDIAKLLEVNTTMHRSRSEQQFQTGWLERIVEKQLEEVEVLSQTFTKTDSPLHERALALVNILSACRRQHVDYELGHITLSALQEYHKKKRLDLPVATDEQDASGFLDRLESTILCYFSFSAKEKLEGANWKILDPFDNELLNHIEKNGEEGCSKAVGHLTQSLALREYNKEGVVKQFDCDYLRYARQSVNIVLHQGEEETEQLVVRAGIPSGEWVLNALENFADGDEALFHALQVCLSQCGASAFLFAVTPDISTARPERLSYTVRRQAEGSVEVKMAARVITSQKATEETNRRAISTHQRVVVSFVLTKSEEQWEVEEGEVKEREVTHWVTDIPELPIQEDESVAGELESFCKKGCLFIQRPKPLNSKKIADLYTTPGSVDTAHEALEKLKAEGTEEALAKAGQSSKEWISRMIAEATGRKIQSIELTEEKRVISREAEQLCVTKLAGGVVHFEGDETLYFPYREKVFPDGKRQLAPLFLTDEPLSPEV